MLLLDAVYINNSGGKVLLDYLVKNLHESKLQVFYLFDDRCRDDYDYIAADKKVYLPSSVSQRHNFYKQHRSNFSKVICFGNVPPTVKLKVPVYTYFHNVLLIKQENVRLAMRLSLMLKDVFIRLFRNNTKYFIVQSGYVKDMLTAHYGIKQDNCLVFPFYENNVARSGKQKSKEDYLYISEGHDHKNHARLLQAWKMVNKTAPELKLHLTVSKVYPELLKQIEEYKTDGCNIVNYGFVTREQLTELYNMSMFTIYPSITESFGLGLIEAAEHGCEVIASNLPYVQAVAQPLAVFDPYNPNDIANKILENRNIDITLQHTKLFVKDEIQALIKELS